MTISDDGFRIGDPLTVRTGLLEQVSGPERTLPEQLAPEHVS